MRLGEVLADLVAVRVLKQRDAMLLLPYLNVDVEVLLFGLALVINNRLACVEHTIVVHIVQIIGTSVIAGIKMRWISTALRRLRCT